MIKHTRYKSDSKGNPCQWICWAGQNEDGIWGTFTTDGRVNLTESDNFKMKAPTFKASVEKNIGKSNFMSFEAQAFEMVQQEIGKKEKENYFETIEEATRLKKFMPMLAEKWKDRKDKITYPVGSQPKLDGARCDIYWCPIKNKVVARTRTSKDYSAVVDHILKELEPLCIEDKSLIFDGELYNHDLKHDFERIMSLTRQSKPTEEDIRNSVNMVQFHIYDIYNSEDSHMTFLERNSLLSSIFNNYNFEYCKLVPTHACGSEGELNGLMDIYLNSGYEGQMIRVLNSVYKPNGRSKDLLKNKVFTDAEFEITDVEEGQGEWKGAVKKLFIKLPSGVIQKCGIDGSYELNKERLANKYNIIGKLATVRYFRLTSDGLLYIPVCKYIDRPDHVE